MKFTIPESIGVLERTPEVVRTMISGLSPEWVHSDYGPATWSVHQVIGHLIWGEETDWIPRVKHILARGAEIPFESFDRQGHESLCALHATVELLDMFAERRASNLAELRGLDLNADDLARRGRHPALGGVTLAELLATWTCHDLNHIAQIAKAMAFQYRDKVGPWIAYLSILGPPNPR